MRTDQEIIERTKEIKSRDWMGTMTGDLVSRLSFDAAKQFLRDDATEADWGDPKPRDHEAIKAEILDYMPFAWDKANNNRGISAGRSLDHMSAWLWLLGRNKAADEVLHYDMYGKPQLRAICEEFGWDWEEWDDGRWTNDECSDGTTPPETVKALSPEPTPPAQ